MPTPATGIATEHDYADGLLGTAGTHERRIRKLFTKYSRRIAKLQGQIAELERERDEAISPHLAGVQKASRELSEWYTSQGGRGSVELPSGTIWSRRDWSVEVAGDETEVVRLLRRRGLKYLSIKVTLNKRTILRDRVRLARVPGLVFSQTHTLHLEPNNLGKTEPPKVSRLTRVLGVVIQPLKPPRRQTRQAKSAA